MVRMRAKALLALCVSTAAYAQGQPAPPTPAPAPAPAPGQPAPPPAPPASDDAVLNEQIATQLVDRALELFDARLYLDAKQLAVEALVKSPKGPAADRARYLIKLVNEHLNIKDEPPPTPPSETPTTPSNTGPGAGIPQPGDRVDMSPIDGPPIKPAVDDEPLPPPAPPGEGNPRTSAIVHGTLYGGTIGATIGAFADRDNPAAVAIPLGIVGGAGVAFASRKLVTRLHWDDAQVRTAGSYSNWGGVIGGMFGDAVTGAGDTSSPTAQGILLGASIGSTVGLGIGVAFARQHKFTRGDVALTDTLSGIGAVGGLTMGMLMQPAQPEAYAVNSILGVGAGLVIGLVAGPQTNTTPRRMLRVAGLSAAGGAAPFLLYAAIYDKDGVGDERLTGFLSSAGLVIGAYVGFRMTAHMDEGLDVQPGTKTEDANDAPVALVGRSSDGSWSIGGIGVQPLSRQLATNSRGVTFTMFGATF